MNNSPSLTKAVKCPYIGLEWAVVGFGPLATRPGPPDFVAGVDAVKNKAGRFPLVALPLGGAVLAVLLALASSNPRTSEAALTSLTLTLNDNYAGTKPDITIELQNGETVINNVGLISFQFSNLHLGTSVTNVGNREVDM